MKPILGFIGGGLIVVVVLLWGTIADACFGYPDETPYLNMHIEP